MAGFDLLHNRLRPSFTRQQILVCASIPECDQACSVLTLWNHSAEVSIGKGMILNLDGQALHRRVHGRLLRHRPTLEHAFRFQAKIVVQTGGMMFLHDKDRLLMRRTSLWARFRGLISLRSLRAGGGM